MVRFAFDNGYGDAAAVPANGDEGPRTRTNSVGSQPEIIRKLSAMFDDLKEHLTGNQMLHLRRNSNADANAAPANAPQEPEDPVPEGKFTGSRTVRIEGVGALTATISAQFHSRTNCTFKIKCYDPAILEQRINTAAQATREIHKIGSFKQLCFKVQGGDCLTLPKLQNGRKQGRMDFSCRLSGLKWDAVQQKIVVSVTKEDEYILSPKLSKLLEELFSQDVVLEAGTCDGVTRFNNWLLRTHQDIAAHAKTKRTQP